MRGGRQGCVLSPHLYSEVILREIENLPGVKVGSVNISNLRCADDTVLTVKMKQPFKILGITLCQKMKRKVFKLIYKSKRYDYINGKQMFLVIISHDP